MLTLRVGIAQRETAGMCLLFRVRGVAFLLDTGSLQECDGARPYCGICTKEILACNYDYDPKVRKTILPKGMACLPCRFVPLLHPVPPLYSVYSRSQAR